MDIEIAREKSIYPKPTARGRTDDKSPAWAVINEKRTKPADGSYHIVIGAWSLVMPPQAVSIRSLPRPRLPGWRSWI